VADGPDPKFLKIVGRETRQGVGIHGIVAERLPVLSQSEALEPLRDIHALSPSERPQRAKRVHRGRSYIEGYRRMLKPQGDREERRWTVAARNL
jgi:hypothetical protein